MRKVPILVLVTGLVWAVSMCQPQDPRPVDSDGGRRGSPTALAPTSTPATRALPAASPTRTSAPVMVETAAQTATAAPSPTAHATPTPAPTRTPAASPTPAPRVGGAPNGNSISPRISADGGVVAFSSWADNLVSGDTNGQADVFLYDRNAGTIVRASVSSDGAQGDSLSVAPSLSASGRWVAFASQARSLAPDDEDWNMDVFVHDTQTGQTERIEVSPGGDRTGRSSSSPHISADGRYVALASLPGDGARTWHVYLHDRQSGQTEWISVGIDGVPGDGWSIEPALAPDGSVVAFWSWAGNLVADDEWDCGDESAPLSCGDVFLYDLRAQWMGRIPVGEGYGLGGGGYELSVSADGRYVALRGWIHDRTNGASTPICGLDADEQSMVRTSVVSGDGRWAAYSDGQVVLCDLGSGARVLVSAAPDGGPGDGPSGIVRGHEGYSGGLDLSADGRWLVFASQAGNLTPGEEKAARCQEPLALGPEAPHCYDIYLYDREEGRVARVGRE